MTLNCRGKLVDLSQPLVMGILNVTPDSFFDGGKHDSGKELTQRIDRLVSEGAHIIDVGGMSSRPGAAIVDPAEEQRRVSPALAYIKATYPEQLVSIDTIHASVAEYAMLHGAHIINDISGGEYDEKIIDVAIKYNSPYIMMHMQGKPQTMQQDPAYTDVVLDLLQYFQRKIRNYRAKGLKDIILDPGFGFGKTVEHNYQMLRQLSAFRILDSPVLVGLSRKSMLYKPLQITADTALHATTAAHMLALVQGAKILRVHDVREARECIHIFQLHEGIN